MLFGPSSPPGARDDVPRGARRCSSWSARPATGVRSSRAASPASDLDARDRSGRGRVEELEPRLPDPLADPRLDFEVERASALAYEVQGGRVHPDHRRPGPPVLRLPRVRRRRARRRAGARARLDRDPLADGERVPAARAVLEVLRPRPGAARRGRPRHRRAVTTRSGSPAPPSTTRTWATSVTSTARRTSTPSCSPYTIEPRRGWPAINFFFNTAFDAHNVYIARRALVATGRLRAAPRLDRPRLPLERLPGRHRPGQRLEPDRDPRPRLPGQGAVLGRDRAPRHTRRRAEADEGDRVPHRAPRR